MININNITVRLGSNVLFDDASLLITRGQKVALIGANGAGKSTLFGLILGQLHADGGEVSIQPNLLINHVAQELVDTNLPAVEFVRQGDKALYTLEQELIEAEKNHHNEKIAEIHMKLVDMEAYTSKSKAAKLLNGLGFSTEDEERPVNAFSGGWRIRLNLARALMSDSDVLLLDEPTNHLDIEAILWLENYLKNYRGTLLLISHDRDFLDAIVDTVAHIDQKKIKRYTGNYTGFETLRAQHLMLQQALFEKQQEKISHMMEFVNRFKAKASKAKQAQSRLKAIARIETVAAVQMASSFTFEFKQPKNVGDPIVYFESVSVGYDNREVLKNISLSIRKGNRVGLLGPNGAGKSTLIKCLAGELGAKKGQITMAQGCGIGYFAQHQLEQLFLDETPLQHMRRIDPRTSELELRKFLGTFNFSGPMALSPIQHFSGGEKARLSLAMLVWNSPNLLLLDEPTNHFDMDMREALTLALQSYDGAMVLVSHDRHMLKSTVDEFYLVADGKVTGFDGDVDDYYRWFLEYKARDNAATTVVQETPKERNMYQFNKEQKKLAQQLKTLEGKINVIRNQLKNIESQLAESSIYESAQQKKLNELLQQQNINTQELNKLEEDWVNLSMKLES